MGRTPVRDALISLSKEGLITFLPQRGTMISKINYDKVLNERFLRTCVEEKVILEFMAVCDLKAITELEMSLDRQEKFVEGGGYTGISGRGYVLSFHFLRGGQQGILQRYHICQFRPLHADPSFGHGGPGHRQGKPLSSIRR